MTLVSPSQSSAGEEINASDINGPINQIAAVVNGNLDDSNISGLSGTKVTAGTLPASAMNTSANVETRQDESMADFVASGCVWSASSGLNGTMTAGVVYVDGKRNAISAVSSRAFTASKDTYVSVNSSGVISYSEVANSAASPALPDNSIWLAKVVTDGTTITSTLTGGSTSIGAAIYPRPTSAFNLYNPIKFSVYRSAALTSSTTPTAVAMDTKLYDTGSNVDVVTNKGRFTAPAAGFYHFSGCAANTGATGVVFCALYKNGSRVKVGTLATGGAGQYSQVSGDLQLTAGDYVELYFTGGSGSTMAVGADACYFDGFLVSIS